VETLRDIGWQLEKWTGDRRRGRGDIEKRHNINEETGRESGWRKNHWKDTSCGTRSRIRRGKVGLGIKPA